MMPPGRELAIGIITDPDFGPLIMPAMGGIYISTSSRTRVFALPPRDLDDARAMIYRLKTVAILRGVRGEQPADSGRWQSCLLTWRA